MKQMINITSRKNAFVKELCEKMKNPSEDNFFIEGHHFVLDIPDSSIIALATSNPGKYQEKISSLLEKDISVYHFTEEIMQKLCDTSSPQNIMAIVKKETCPLPEKLVILDRIQDPGNAGTIIRTAAAFGFGVILANGSVNPYAPKTVRSSAGAILSCYVSRADLCEIIPGLKKNGYKIYSTVPGGNAKSLNKVTYSGPQALIIGNEGAGISDSVLPMADESLFIPMTGYIESLNAAVAAAIFMYEFR